MMGIIRKRNSFFQDVTLTTMPITHVPWFKSIGLKLTIDGEPTLAYPGDVGSDQDFQTLADAFRGVKLLLIESGYPTATPNHFSIPQTKELLTLANIERALLIHIKPLRENEERIQREIQNDTRLSIGNDKQIISLS